MHRIVYQDINNAIVFVYKALAKEKKKQIEQDKCAGTIDHEVYIREPDNAAVESFITQLVDCNSYNLEKEKENIFRVKRELAKQYNTPMGVTQLCTDVNYLDACISNVSQYLSAKHYTVNNAGTVNENCVHKSSILFRELSKLLDYIIVTNLANKKFHRELIPIANIKSSVAKSIFDMIELKKRLKNLENFKQKHDEWRQVVSDYYTNLYLVRCCIKAINSLKKTSIHNFTDVFPFITTVQDFHKQFDISYYDMCRESLKNVHISNRIEKVNYGYNNEELTLIDFICGGNSSVYGNLPKQNSRILIAFNTEMNKYFPHNICVPTEITDDGKNVYKYKFGFTNEDLSTIAKQTILHKDHISPFATLMLTQLAGKMLLTRKFIAKASKSQDLDKFELTKIFNKLQTGFIDLFHEYLQYIDAACFLNCDQYLNKLANQTLYNNQKLECIRERNKLQEMFIVFRKIQSGLEITKSEFENCFKKGSFAFEDVNDKDLNIFKIKEREEIYNEYYKTFVKATAPVGVLTTSGLLFCSSVSIQSSFILSIIITTINFLINRVSIKENLNIIDIYNMCFHYLKSQVEKISSVFISVK